MEERVHMSSPVVIIRIRPFQRINCSQEVTVTGHTQLKEQIHFRPVTVTLIDLIQRITCKNNLSSIYILSKSKNAIDPADNVNEML